MVQHNCWLGHPGPGVRTSKEDRPVPMAYLRRRTSASVGSRPRECTDVLWLVVFAVTNCMLGYLLVLSVQRGDLRKMVHGRDYMSDMCGMDNSPQATNVPLVVTVVLHKPSVWDRVWIFGNYPEPIQANVTRGGRDHRADQAPDRGWAVHGPADFHVEPGGE